MIMRIVYIQFFIKWKVWNIRTETDLRIGYRCRELESKWICKDFTNLHDETIEFKNYVNIYGLHKLHNLIKECERVIRRRTKLRNILKSYIELKRDVYFITLTFNDKILNSKDLKSVKLKARRFLHSICDYYTFIEEYGSENDRYHIHGVVILIDDNWELIKKWSYRQNIKKINFENKSSIKKVPKYLCKYLNKDTSRITMCKKSIDWLKNYKSYINIREIFETLD